jgi:signal transduction histidine kinase/phage shock protein PspC (stress-responsive transcriptional regulator)
MRDDPDLALARPRTPQGKAPGPPRGTWGRAHGRIVSVTSGPATQPGAPGPGAGVLDSSASTAGAVSAPTPSAPGGAPAAALPGPTRPVLRRRSDGRLLAGVAAGLADHLGLDVVHVRVALALLAGVGGFGVVLYGALWVVVPVAVHGEAEAAGLAAASRSGRRPWRPPRPADVGQLVAFGAFGVGLVLLLNTVTPGLPLPVLVPLLIAAAGVALLWTQADATERARLLPAAPDPSAASRGTRVGRVVTGMRIVGGLALVTVAVLVFLVGTGQQAAIGDALLLLVVVGLGLALVLGPLLWRLLRQLDDERRERLLTQQQADVAAHLHDSVLQTLALIQRKAQDPRAVVALARAQERDLRGWLFEPEAARRSTLRAELEDAAAQVEQAHGVPVEVVVVGDCPLDGPLSALVRAAREAMVNAARHADAPVVDVFAECVENTVEVFVRDRGRGFDPATVPPDRMGLAGSVVGRMERHGGTARVRSAPGEGTEISLSMPRAQPGAAPVDEEET